MTAEETPKDLGKTSINMDPKVAALLAYIAGLISGIVLFVIEKDNRFVRFHAMQSILASGTLFVLQTALAFLPGLGLLSPIISLAGVVLWVVCMIKAYQGEWFKLPILGDIAERQVDGTNH